MKIKKSSYRFAEEILSHPKHNDELSTLIRICQQCPLPVYKGKSKKQDKKDVIQQLINTYFSLRLCDEFGWSPEAFATPKTEKDSLRCDFRKEIVLKDDSEISSTLKLQIEVELGNAASLYRDYFKFQSSFSNNLADIGILIVPAGNLDNRIDSGVGNFDKVVRELTQAKLSVTVPILVIGLDDTDEPEWDVKSVQPNLKICKNLSKAYYERHKLLMQDYIRSSI